MANRKKNLPAKSKKKYRQKNKRLQQDVAVHLPKSITTGTRNTKVGIIEDNCSAEPADTLSALQPSPVLGTQVVPAPKEDILSTEQNNKQDHVMPDGNNITPNKPAQLIMGKVNFPVSEDISTFHPQLANDQDISILEYCKENIPCGQQTTNLSVISTDKEDTSFNKKDSYVAPDQQITSLEETSKTDIALDGPISPFNLTNNEMEHIQTDSPVLQQHFPNNRPKTPNVPIPITEMFSPNTVNEFRSTLRNLFPNGPPPSQPIRPVKKRKKGDTPYIVGCTKRRRVPEKKTLNVFKGDKKYGVTEETNSFADEECHMKRKRGKKKQYGNWSKSRFNPKSDEIAARLKMNENVDEILRKSPSKETVSYMSKPYVPRPQAFSPLPSTSKDSETIMKNEKHFSESLNYEKSNLDIYDDDDELPDIQWETKKHQKKPHKSLLRSRDIELINKSLPSVKNEDMNNNNDIANHEEVDFYEIEFDKYMPKKEFTVPSVTTTTDANPIVIDDNNVDSENVEVEVQPKRVLCEIKEITDTIEINDEYSSITYEDLYSVPKSTEVVDVDELIKEMQAFKQKSKRFNQDIITIVDPANIEASHNTPANPISIQASHDHENVNNLVPTQESLIKDKSKSTAIETAEVIEIPDVEPIDNLTKQTSTSRFNKTCSWDDDVEFVSESIGKQNNVPNNIETVVIDFFNDYRNNTSGTHRVPNPVVRNSDVANDLGMLFSFITEQCSRLIQPKQRKKKSKKSQSPKKAPEQQLQPQLGTVGNENAAPSTNGQVQASPVNGERKLADCPICMENLSSNAIASTTCGHVFCLGCIRQCLRSSGKKCPTCRKTLKGAGYHQVFL